MVLLESELIIQLVVQKLLNLSGDGDSDLTITSASTSAVDINLGDDR